MKPRSQICLWMHLVTLRPVAVAYCGGNRETLATTQGVQLGHTPPPTSLRQDTGEQGDTKLCMCAVASRSSHNGSSWSGAIEPDQRHGTLFIILLYLIKNMDIWVISKVKDHPMLGDCCTSLTQLYHFFFCLGPTSMFDRVVFAISCFVYRRHPLAGCSLCFR